MTTLRLGYGPLLLLMYQAAPVSVQQDSLGRYRIGVGFSTGQWENEEFSCDGQLLSATPVRHHSAGVQIEAWPENNIRLTAFGGTTSQSVAATSSDVEPFAGPYRGVQVAYEGPKSGFGLGFTKLSGFDRPLTVAPYLRLGNIDGAHFRLDVLTPNPALPSVAWGRVGVGVSNGHLRRPGGFLGLGFGPADYNSKAAFLGELHFPIARHLTGQVHGLFGPGEQNDQWNMGAGLQVDFGGHR